MQLLYAKGNYSDFYQKFDEIPVKVKVLTISKPLPKIIT